MEETLISSQDVIEFLKICCIFRGYTISYVISQLDNNYDGNLKSKVQKLKQNLHIYIYDINNNGNKLNATKAVCNKQRSYSRIAYSLKLRVIKLFLYNKLIIPEPAARSAVRGY
jgi:hypothetical protein